MLRLNAAYARWRPTSRNDCRQPVQIFISPFVFTFFH
jgi:hypothetical protein